MKISVIIPAYNAQHTIAKTLEALQKQDYPDPFEVIVVDDGSVDDTARVVRGFSAVRYVYQVNAGPAAARNHGARIAKGVYLAFTDSDCVPRPDWISMLMRGFTQHEVAVVMGGYGIANPDIPLASCVHREIVFRHARLMPDFPKVFGSYNFCVKKEIFGGVGGFDVSYRNASGEDNDLSYKIGRAAGRIYFKRDALVDHYHPVKVSKYLKEQFRHGFWRAQMYVTHPAMLKGDGYTFWKDMVEVVWSLGLAVLPLGLAFSGFDMRFFFLMLIVFFVFQYVFAWAMLEELRCKLFWAFVMFLRAFSRSFGLSTGFLSIFSKKKVNKS